MRLDTPKLVIRDFTEEDLTALHPPVGDVAGKAIQPFDLRDGDAVRAQIRYARTTAKDDPRLTFDLAVTRRSDGALIGRGGLKRNADEPREAFIWLLSDPATWNQGLTHEAATGLLTCCFGTLGLHRVTSECDPASSGALELMKTLGLRREATFVENSWARGKWVDTAVFALLDREWTARSKG